MNKRIRTLVTVSLLCATPALPAAVLSDRLDWGSLGNSYDLVGSPFTVTSALGQSVNVGQSGGAFFRLDQGGGWFGNFTAGEELLWTYYGGPIVLDFGSTGATGIRFQIQAELYGGFEAVLQVFDTHGALMGSRSGLGQSTPMGDGTALELSLSNTPFRLALIQLVSSTDLSSFAINTVDFEPGGLATSAYSQTVVPEPASFGVAGAAVAALLLLGKRGRQ